MADKEIVFQKKRELGDILSDTFLFLKSEFKPLSKLILIYIVPFMVLYAILQVNAQQKLLNSGILGDPQTLMDNLIPFYKNIFISFLYNVFVQSLFIALIYSYIELYIKNGKGNFTASDVSAALFSNSLLALGAGIFIFIVSLIGAMMCFLPGIYFANTFSLLFVILIFEKKGFNMGLSVCWKLVHSQWWNTFLLNLVTVIIVIAIGFVISIPTMMVSTGVTVVDISQGQTPDYPQWYWILIGVVAAASSLFYIIPYVALAFQYFNIKVRMDGPKEEVSGEL